MGSMANVGFNLPGFSEVNIPLGSYPTQLSPWGLLDTAGGMREWMETGIYNGDGSLAARVLDGSGWGSSQGTASSGDYAGYRAGSEPGWGLSDFGFRLAATIPAPGAIVLGVVAGVFFTQRTRTRGHGG